MHSLANTYRLLAIQKSESAIIYNEIAKQWDLQAIEFYQEQPELFQQDNFQQDDFIENDFL